MLTPKFKHYAERIKKLIEEGKGLLKLEKSTPRGPSYIQGEDQIAVEAWNTSVRNIIEITFGKNSPQFHQLVKITDDGKKRLFTNYDIHPLIGLLQGAHFDLENGFLTGQEYLIAGDIFDNVLEQAKYLNKEKYKDPAAILARVVVEDALKRIARTEGINDSMKLSKINDELKKIGRYTQPQWRQIQVWIDIGNAAAHGKFTQYKQSDVKKMIEDIERFLAAELRI